MERLKPYDVPHKGLRNALSQLQLLAGKTNYADQYQVAQLHQLGRDVFEILTIHASDEDEITLAELEQRCRGCSQHDTEDHEKIHLEQANLETLLTSIYNNSKAGTNVISEGAEFYLSLSEFHARYLEHTAKEERITQPLLWNYFTDEELASHRGRIMSKNPPQTLLTWFRFVIPAQSRIESVALLTGFKKMASGLFFNEALHVIRQVLPGREYDDLNEALQ